MLGKISFKCEFSHNLEFFYALETIWQHMRKKNQKYYHLYEDQHTRQETAKSCRLSPPVCKLLRFLFNFTMRIFADISCNFPHVSFKLQLKAPGPGVKRWYESLCFYYKLNWSLALVIVKRMLNGGKVQKSKEKILFHISWLLILKANP